MNEAKSTVYLPLLDAYTLAMEEGNYPGDENDFFMWLHLCYIVETALGSSVDSERVVANTLVKLGVWDKDLLPPRLSS